VCVDERGLSDWAALHRAVARRNCPEAILFAFDLLFLDGQDCRGSSLLERKRALAERLAKVPMEGAIRYVEAIEGDGPTILRHACALGLEGIVSKVKHSSYRSGRSVTWRKVKCPEAQERQRQRFEYLRQSDG
jgi:bifunctional non-homologous end joining protein LigD